MQRNEIITGRFARPILKNGTGFGIAYSTAERKKHKAEKKASFLIAARHLLKVNHQEHDVAVADSTDAGCLSQSYRANLLKLAAAF